VFTVQELFNNGKDVFCTNSDLPFLHSFLFCYKLYNNETAVASHPKISEYINEHDSKFQIKYKISNADRMTSKMAREEKKMA
jgi:hypothetical protein